ncbi:hypothetical protein KEX41_29090 (plasmid) [Burkholderia thailandensis]|uniref:hypothetical protein n=1 Tax=Burkholderia thailandensis TaxID=57975 RepID=UPI00192D4A3E|nr:hypothetical protein [Burkholderia thailandensis]MBS2132242.1 hypothetical protein [Burkholderia thailandensis]QRA15334.1 hypothetical protein JMY07_29515 [Burkholderia thailandensis]
MDGSSWILKAIVIVLVAIGLVAALGIASMAVMHFDMMHGWYACGDAIRAWR